MTTKVRIGAFPCTITKNRWCTKVLGNAGLRTEVQVDYGFDSLHPLLIFNDLGFKSERSESFFSDLVQKAFPFLPFTPDLRRICGWRNVLIRWLGNAVPRDFTECVIWAEKKQRREMSSGKRRFRARTRQWRSSGLGEFEESDEGRVKIAARYEVFPVEHQSMRRFPGQSESSDIAN